MSVAHFDRAAATRQGVVIRFADPSDHAAIREVINAAYGQYETAMGPDAFDNYLEDLLDLERHARNGQLVVAEVGGSVRGYGAFYPDIAAQKLGWPPGWAGGRGLAVHPAARGIGVAHALIGACEDLAYEYGAPVFAFHTLELMGDARASTTTSGMCAHPSSTGPATALRRDRGHPDSRPCVPRDLVDPTRIGRPSGITTGRSPSEKCA